MCVKPQAFVLYKMPCPPKWHMTVGVGVVAMIRAVSILSDEPSLGVQRGKQGKQRASWLTKRQELGQLNEQRCLSWKQGNFRAGSHLEVAGGYKLFQSHHLKVPSFVESSKCGYGGTCVQAS